MLEEGTMGQRSAFGELRERERRERDRLSFVAPTSAPASRSLSDFRGDGARAESAELDRSRPRRSRAAAVFGIGVGLWLEQAQRGVAGSESTQPLRDVPIRR